MAKDLRESALSLQGVKKSFGGIPVLQSINFAIRAGEITAMAGENGAGKSTLLKIISGQLSPDEGQVVVGSEKITEFNPKNAHRKGVAIIPQELAPYLDLSVYENLWVGRELKNSFGTLDRREMVKRSKTMLELFGLDIDVRKPMREVSVALTQIIEIAKATTWGATVLLLDEPTSSISDKEVERLYELVRRLKSNGVAMIYTTHRMSEIQDLADHVVVLRDGHVVMNSEIKQASADDIVTSMIGRKLENLFPIKNISDKPARFVVENLRLNKTNSEISFSVRAGEILGFGGLIGAGRTEIVEAVFGARKTISGTITLDGKNLHKGDIAKSISNGIAFVPEDRKRAGLVLSATILDNGSLPNLFTFTMSGWIRSKKRNKEVSKVMTSVNLKSKGMGQLTGTLSGGNQQKVVLARWLTNEIKVLILDEPTRGVDVGARSEIYSLINELAATGIAVVLVTSDMAELIGLSHRILIVRSGSIVGGLSKEELEQENAQEQIFRLASGQIS
jgi:ribose transport system ATP-binding protein